MNLTKKLFALKRTPCFDGIQESDLALIAAVATERRFTPDELICSADRPLTKLYVVVEGAITNEAGDPMYPVLGAPSLLFDIPVPWRLQASAESGATCLTFNKGHFYAMLNQCPSLIISLRELSIEQLAAAAEGGSR